MLSLIVLLCAQGMTLEDCRAGRWLERYISDPVPPQVCIEQAKALQELKPRSPAGTYFWGCVPSEIRASPIDIPHKITVI
jgi:hypothetical protein